MTLASETLAPARPVRPFYWSVRRELWENPAVWIAPLAVVAVVIFASLFALPNIERTIRLAEGEPVAIAAAQARAEVKVARDHAAHPERKLQAVMTPAQRQADARMHLRLPYSAAAGAMFVISWFVAIFFSLNALQGERRDRSILFWKSMPVSNVTSVAAKAAIPLAVQPVLIVGVVIAAQLAILAISTLVATAGGVGPERLWAQLNLPLMWTMLPYGMVVNMIWDVPFYGWLFLVSGWAKKNTFVWAVVPWLALALFEFMINQSRYVLELMGSRIFGGFALAYTVNADGKTAIEHFGQIDAGRVISSPGLWGGLVVGGAMFAACVWLRRTRDPI